MKEIYARATTFFSLFACPTIDCRAFKDPTEVGKMLNFFSCEKMNSVAMKNPSLWLRQETIDTDDGS